MTEKLTITVTESTWQEIYLAFGRLDLWDGEPPIDDAQGTIDLGNVILKKAKIIARIETSTLKCPDDGIERDAFAVFERRGHGVDYKVLVTVDRAKAQEYIDERS